MKLGKYLKDKIFIILICIVAMVLSGLILIAFKVPIEAAFTVLGVFLVSGLISLGIDFSRKRRFYQELLEKVEQLDQAYLVLETMREPEFYEGELTWQAMKEINKSMAENVQTQRERSQDFQEYIEMWIHEVKRPLASLGLVVENLWKTPKNTKIKAKTGKISKLEKYGPKEPEKEREIQQNLRELEKYVEQVLYFVRSENAEKDYLIHEVDLSNVIKKVGLRNMYNFLDNKVEFETKITDCKVYTDAKWLEFVVNQIVDNSIKYRKEKGAKVIIRVWKQDKDLSENGDKNRTENGKNRTILEIEDNGIGIAAKDLPMVFEKTFTGSNGRKGMVSTGMGLYIAKNLCEKLGHKIEIESKEENGTKVRIIFENNGFYGVVK